MLQADNTQTVNRPGVYVIEEVTWHKANGMSVKINEQVDQLILHEDLYTPFMTGKVIIRDTYDLPNEFGRGGRDLVSITAYTPSLPQSEQIRMVFWAYKIGDRVNVSHRNIMYTLYLIEVDAINDFKNVSKRLSGTPEEICAQVFRDELEVRNTQIIQRVEKPNAAISFVSNFWRPSEVIAYALKNTECTFAYRNRAGYHISDFRTMASRQAPTIQNFRASDYYGSVEGGSLSYDPLQGYSSILDIKINQYFDMLDAGLSGAVQQNVISFDTLNKRYRNEFYTMINRGPGLLNPVRTFSNATIQATDPEVGFDNIKPMHLKRNSYLSAMRQTIVELKVFGRTDYTVGRKVNVYVPRMGALRAVDSEYELSDKHISGNYIITGIVHSFERVAGAHLCTLELRKESTEAV